MVKQLKLIMKLFSMKKQLLTKVFLIKIILNFQLEKKRHIKIELI